MLPHVTAIRYVTPLREGGSLPGLMEADDFGVYVVKYRGAGQGRKALVAEVISGQLARALGLPVPELATVELDPALAAAEPDQEVQDLLRASGGLNLGMDFLPGALDFDASAFAVSPELAGRVLWFDALVNNVDRSWRNPNLLYWHGELYLIDHGATLTFHHNWPATRAGAASAERPYDAAEHALLGAKPMVDAADAALAPLVSADLLAEVVGQAPVAWLADEPGFDDVEQVRAGYVAWLQARVRARDAWLPGLREAVRVAGTSGASGAADASSTASGARGGRPDWLRGGGAA